jgi:hypothetical protein
MNERRRIKLDGDLYFGDSLFAGDTVAKLENLLCGRAPRWCRDAYVYVAGEAKRPLDFGAGSLAAELRRAATARATPFYRQLEEAFGSAAGSHRAVGQVEIRSSDPSLILIIKADEDVVAEAGSTKSWANSISVQVRRGRVETEESSAWLRHFMIEVARQAAPAYGRALLADEFQHKNLVDNAGHSVALGVDFANGLPSLYWLSIFGSPYIELLGRQKILTSPAPFVEEVGEAVVIALGESPFEWNTDEYRSREEAVLAHIGHEYFFSKDAPERRLLAPALFK